MRTFLALFTLLLVSSFAVGQDNSAAQAMQAAQQSAQLATQQAMDANQQAAQQSMQNNLNSEIPSGCCALAALPKFSMKPGTYSTPTVVRITDSTRGAIIYYSTDGWTPTSSSQRYLGPITISSTTTLRAIAIAPRADRSFVATAQYIFKPANLPATSPAQSTATSYLTPPLPDGKFVLPQGAPVPLVFTSPVNSKTASVGDAISLTLSDDLTNGNVILVKKGTAATGVVIQVDKSGAGGAPGVLVFQVNALNLNGTLIKLAGTASTEGDAKPPNAAVLIPVVGPLTIFKHGTDAVISAGTPFTASLAADTSLEPVEQYVSGSGSGPAIAIPYVASSDLRMVPLQGWGPTSEEAE